MTLRTYIIGMFLGLSFFSCKKDGSSQLREAEAATAEVTLSVIGLNDLHGGGLSVNDKFSVGAANDRQSVKIGGPAAMMAYISAVEKANPDGTLLLDAGDSYQGSLVSNNSRGQAIVNLYNYIGVDASTIGNHEFDWGGFLSPSAATEKTFESPFLRIAEKTSFPFLAHNMAFKSQPLEKMPVLSDPNGKTYNLKFSDGTPKLASYAMFSRKGVKVAVIGGITAGAMDNSSVENYRDVTISPIGDGLGKLAQHLKAKEGAQVVVLLMHAGFACGFSSFDYQDDQKNTSSACPEINPGTDEIRTIFAKLEKDGFSPKDLIDVVVAGHVHAPQAHYYEGVPVIQNADKGLGFGRVDIKFNKGRNTVTARQIFPPTLFCHKHFANYPGCDPKGPDYNRPFPAKLGHEVAAVYGGAPINIQTYERGAQAALAPFKNLLEDKDKPITKLDEGLLHDRFVESVMSRCYVDAIRLAADVDLVIAISGGIRESLPKGEITAGHIFEVAPFDGGAVEVTMTGKELVSYVQMKNKDFNIKSMPIISEGFKLKVSCSAPGEAVSPVDIFEFDSKTKSWKNIDAAKTYKVVVSGYLFENPFFNDFRASKSKVLKSDRDLLTAGFSRSDRPKSCTAKAQVIKKCDDSHDGSRWCGLTKTCPSP